MTTVTAVRAVPALPFSRWARWAPCLVVAVAYVDPGNIVTNTEAGARTGARLVWVVVLAGALAMVLQYLSAKLGAVTGRSLGQHLAAALPAWGRRLVWAQGELVAVATEVTEVVGGALALHLLTGVPLPIGGAVVAVAGTALVTLDAGSRTRFAAVTGIFVAAVVAGGLYQAFRVGGAAPATVHGLVPGFGGADGLLLATGIVGATVMPHTVYLHSALTPMERAGRRDLGRVLRDHRRTIVVALGVASVGNVATLVVAARAVPGAGSVEDAVRGLRAVGSTLPLAFALALLLSGLAASGVGTLAGEVLMRDLLGRRVPVLTRRMATVAPALAVLCLPVSATSVLVGSQLVLALGVPVVLVPLVVLTSRRSVMGVWVNGRRTALVAGTATAAITALDVLTVLR